MIENLDPPEDDDEHELDDRPEDEDPGDKPIDFDDVIDRYYLNKERRFGGSFD